MGIRDWFGRLLRGKTKEVIASPEVLWDLPDTMGQKSLGPGEQSRHTLLFVEDEADTMGQKSLGPGEQSRHTLLIVEDEADVLQSLRHLFYKTYHVLTACSATEAIELLMRNDVHLILSDQRMPGMSGDAFLSRARQLQPNAIQMLFTGYTDIRAVIDTVNEGHIFRYILKPWDPIELEGIIRQAAKQYDLVAERDRLQTELETLMARPVHAAPQVREGQVIGNYQLQKKLGEGGMGAVYQAIHLPLSRIVAFKVLPPDRLHDAEAVAPSRGKSRPSALCIIPISFKAPTRARPMESSSW